MPISKQEFYEGAALTQLLRRHPCRIQFQSPFYLLNEGISLYIKYCTRVRTPWGFTFTPQELENLLDPQKPYPILIGLVCGDDGIAAISAEELLAILPDARVASRVSCARPFGHHYTISGPSGKLSRKAAPTKWQQFAAKGL